MGTTKIERAIDRYGLQGLGEELERDWTDDGDDRRSLRELADYVNRRILAAAMAEAGVNAIGEDAGDVYRRLTGEDVSSGTRTRVRRRLDRDGVDVDRVEDDFVSYQAVRTYLKGRRDAEHGWGTKAGRTEREARTLRRLENRMTAVAEDKLAQLRNDSIVLGEFRVLTDVSVFCEDCETQYEVATLLERGGCDCA